MSGALQNAKSAIIVTVMTSCPACQDYKPRLHAQAERFQQHGVPIVFYEEGMQIERGQIPIVFLDATSPDPSMQAFLNQYNVQGLPTTILMRQSAAPVVYEGAIEDAQIFAILIEATKASR
jgi:thiol-disulfide isomerase/thioredoxin